MSKHPQKRPVTNQRSKPAETQPLETAKATVIDGSSSKSAWSLTKIQVLSAETSK